MQEPTCGARNNLNSNKYPKTKIDESFFKNSGSYTSSDTISMSGYTEILTNVFIYIVAAFIVIKILSFFWSVFKKIVPFSFASSSIKKKDKNTGKKNVNNTTQKNDHVSEEEEDEEEDEEYVEDIKEIKKNGRKRAHLYGTAKKKSIEIEKGRDMRSGEKWGSRNETTFHTKEARNLKIPRSKTICHVSFLNGKEYVVDGGERSSLLPITIPFLEKRNQMTWVKPSSKTNSLLDVVITDTIDVRAMKMGCSITRRDLNTQEPLFVVNIELSLNIINPHIMFADNSADVGIFIKKECDIMVKNLVETVETWVIGPDYRLKQNNEENHHHHSSSRSKTNGVTPDDLKAEFMEKANKKALLRGEVDGWVLNIDYISYSVCLTQADKDKAWHEREMKKVKELSKTYQEYLIMTTEVAVEVIQTLKKKHPDALSSVPIQDMLPVCLNQFNTINYTNIPVKSV